MADLSDEEDSTIPQNDVFLINILDEVSPFDKRTLRMLKDYVLAFFGIPLEVIHTPQTPASSAGASAMAEKTNRPLRRRIPRPDKPNFGFNSIRLSHLFECMHQQQKNGGGIGPFPDCIGILGVTSGELYEDESNLLPEDYVEEDRIYKYGASRPDLGLSALSLAHLKPEYKEDHTCNLKRPANENMEYPDKHRYRIYIRNLLKAVTHFLLKLMGNRDSYYTKGCDNHRCLIYRQPFRPEKHSLFFCCKCEIHFCEKMTSDMSKYIRFFRAPEGSDDGKTPSPPIDHYFFALTRYQKMYSSLKTCNEKLMSLLYKFRTHYEFEREIEWLTFALKVFAEVEQERHHYVSKRDTHKVTKRSLYRLLQVVHERTPSIQVLHRTLAEPFLKIQSLTDMKESGPHQTPVPLDNEGMARVYFNKKHSTGGTYLETSGNLNPKEVGNFPVIGLNACLLKANNPMEKDDKDSKKKILEKRVI